MKRLLLLAAIVAIAVALIVAFTIPARRLTLPNPSPDGTVPGILHVHSNRSDGQSSPVDIAAAAARAGLKFVVFTDHGDATRAPDPPAYLSGVLCLDGVEISTTGGHYLALDMPAAPYPLGGEPRDVVEDVGRLGGFGVAAHPNSPKPDLRWRDWTAPIDGIETLNMDSGWRIWAQRAGFTSPAAGTGSSKWAARRRLAAALLDYPFRPAEVMASLLPGDAAAGKYAALAAHRRVVSLAGADAHASLQYGGDPASSRWSLPMPGYEATFRTMSVHVEVDQPFTGDASADGAALMRAIRAGHSYMAVDGFATPPAVRFSAVNSGGTAAAGDELHADGMVTLRVKSNAPATFTTTVWGAAGILSGDHHEPDFTVRAPAGPGVYWTTIAADHSDGVAWVRTNPIYIRAPETASPPVVPPPVVRHDPIYDGTSVDGWHLEHDPNSQAAFDGPARAAGAELRLRYALAGGAAAGQFVALVYDTPHGAASAAALRFTARAEHPMRVSVQLRVPRDRADGGERWQRSVYIAPEPAAEHVVSFDDMTSIGTTETARPPLAEVRSILFVIDTVNTKPGASGRLWIKSAALDR